jgi:hypothetical protein
MVVPCRLLYKNVKPGPHTLLLSGLVFSTGEEDVRIRIDMALRSTDKMDFFIIQDLMLHNQVVNHSLSRLKSKA